VSRDETLEHAFKRGAFFGGHTAKELDIILVGERGEERDQRRACACGFQSVRAAILRTFLAYDQSFLDQAVCQFADSPAREAETLGQATGANGFLAVEFVQDHPLGNGYVFVR
jgi:hypothetical protein